MKRYRFSLESALRVRRVQEEGASFALAHANHRLQAAVARYRSTLARYDALAAAGGEHDLEAFRRQRDEAERLAAAVHHAWSQVEEATDEVAARHADWVEATRRVGALERLDERRRAEWLAEERAAETAAIDESALSRWLADATEVRAALGPDEDGGAT